MPFEASDQRAVITPPEFGRAILGSRGEGFPVGREHHAVHAVRMALQGAYRRSVGAPEYFNGPIGRTHGEGISVGGKFNAGEKIQILTARRSISDRCRWFRSRVPPPIYLVLGNGNRAHIGSGDEISPLGIIIGIFKIYPQGGSDGKPIPVSDDLVDVTRARAENFPHAGRVGRVYLDGRHSSRNALKRSRGVSGGLCPDGVGVVNSLAVEAEVTVDVEATVSGVKVDVFLSRSDGVRATI
jgi:hypothetical protein